MQEPQKSYLNTEKSAEYIGLSPKTLERWRVTGEGPTYSKIGSRCLYSKSDLDTFMESRKVSSTSEYGV